ncbi:2-oxoglutarate oxidoreductase subunit KorA [bacterium HR19]|nr:2-oxoglutarate oxidoreductase subunit KorA [bacterium HR19]
MIVNWLIGGPQGMGVDTSANSFARSCAYAGYWVFGKREYHSNITGEHSYFIVTVSDKPVHSFRDKLDVLSTSDERTLRLHINDVKSGGAVIYDAEISLEALNIKRDDLVFVPIKYNEIIKETAEKFGLGDVKKLQVMRNSICVFASAGLLELPAECVEESMKHIFTGKRTKVLEPNKYAGLVAYKYAQSFSHKIEKKLPKREVETKRVILTGTQATALGKLAAGCRFQTYYPITPATDESEFLESIAKKYNMVVIQAEDEIAAITMSIGASLAGARASSSTSGPGFSLMAEALGWAGMNEVPIVVIDYQRGGPSTGLPTRHEQGDLKFAIYAGHGEFPRIVLSPGDIEEAFYIVVDAFNLAEKYQCPVIVLEDKLLANSVKTINQLDLSKLKIERGKILYDSQNGKMLKKFKRFEFSEDGISPRVFLGHEGFIFWNSGDEHDEFGHITEDPENRLRMHEKRLKKLQKIVEETPVEKKIGEFGNPDSKFVVVTWGSTVGVALSALEELKEEKGVELFLLQIKMIHPLDAELVKSKIKGKVKIAVENNYSGQLASHITEKTGEFFDHLILKWTGRPISHDELISALEKIIKMNYKEKRLVLSAGI